MDWRRRQLLTVIGASGVGTLAGCGGLLTGGEESNRTGDGESDYLSQEAKLAPEDGDSGDEFGNAVALADDGSMALVAAEEDEDPNGEGAGSAYIFGRTDNGWSQGAKLAPEDGVSGDGFGESVALAEDGSTALVGAETADDPNGEQTGAAYVFARDGNSWSQQAKLVANDGDDGDRFGFSVALAGDGSTALIGAEEDDEPNGEAAGAAYVFARDGTSWSQGAKLAPEDGDSGDDFGWRIALAEDGSTALVGAYEDDEPNGEEAGSAYVFARSGNTWSQGAKLAPGDGDSGDKFGESVALAADGSIALIGTSLDDNSNGEEAGSAYVYARDGTSWSQQAKLVAEDGDEEDWFGFSVALADDGSTGLIAALGDRNDSGSAYVFSSSGDNWSQGAKLASDDGDSLDLFGASVALDGDGSTALLGAQLDDDPNGDEAGSAYVFEEPWAQ
jgi:hypothetical protein